MAAGIFRRRQPGPNQPLRVNASHPLAPGLGLFGWGIGGNRLWDALTGKVIDLSAAANATGTFVRGAGRIGPTLRMAGGERGGGAIYNPTSRAFTAGTLAAALKPTQAVTGGATRPYVAVGNSSLDRGLIIGMSGTASHAWGVTSSNGWLFSAGSGVDEQVWRTVGVNVTPGVSQSVEGWLDGAYQAAASHTGVDIGSSVPTRIWFGRDPSNYYAYPTGDIGWVGYWTRRLDRGEHRLLHEDAWSLVVPASLVQGWRLAVAAGGGGDTALAAAATGSGLAAGALTTAIRLAASPGGAGTATAALTTAIRLSAAAPATGVASGTLTTSIALVAAATGGGVAAAALTTGGAALAASATGMGVAAAALTTEIRLVAAATGAGTATGSLTTGSAGLAAAATGSGTASGALTTGIRLAATATGTGTVAGALTTAIRLAAAAVASGAAAGSLTTGIALSAAPVGAGTAAGALTTAIRLAAAAVGSGTATGRLIADVPPSVTPLRTIRLRAPRALALPQPAMPALPKPRRLVA